VPLVTVKELGCIEVGPFVRHWTGIVVDNARGKDRTKTFNAGRHQPSRQTQGRRREDVE
jgi:hypothetical protein